MPRDVTFYSDPRRGWLNSSCESTPHPCPALIFRRCVEGCSVADVVFLIDNSGSIRDNEPPSTNNWQLILDFVSSVVEMLDVRPEAIRVGLVDFGQSILNIIIFSPLGTQSPRGIKY